jgi:hypothetical protein
MTVDNPSVIDFIAHEPKADSVLFVLVEHRDWGSAGRLLPDLQAKLNTYLAYLVDGRFEAEYPAYQGKPVCFDLRTAYPLGPRELEFIAIVERQHLSPRGIRFTWKRSNMHAGSTAEAGGRSS